MPDAGAKTLKAQAILADNLAQHSSMRHFGHDWGSNRRLSARFGTILFAATAAFLLSMEARCQTNDVLTNLAQVQALSLQQGAAGLPLKVRAVITFIDPDWRMCFLHDAGAGVYLERTVRSEDPSWNLPVGEMIEVEGVTTKGIIQCNIKEQTLRDLGMGRLPTPKLLQSDESFAATKDSSWVKAMGVITGMRTRGARLEFDLRVNANRTLRLNVLHGNATAAGSLIGCTVEATGAFGLELNFHNLPTGRNVIWLNDLSGIGRATPMPVTPVADLESAARRTPGQLARVRGNVTSARPGEFFFVRDETGTVRVNYSQITPAGIGGRVEVIGCPTLADDALMLTDVSAIPVAAETEAPAAPPALPVPTAANTNLPTLTRAAQVRNLIASEAEKAFPVRITGTVTYNDATNGAQFVQDDSGGIYVDTKRKKFDSFPDPPQRVVITGFTGPGDYAPVIEAEQLQALGEGAFPKPLSVTTQALMTGAEDSQWITVEGVVRSQSVTADGVTALNVATRDSVIEADVPMAVEHPAPKNFVDTRVQIAGVCGTLFDNQRRLRGVKLYVPGWAQVIATGVGAEDPFALGVRPISELLKFHGGIEGLHRSHVRGIVSASRIDGSFYLQDDTGAILIQPEEGTKPVRPGSAVDLVGFPSVLNEFPVLQEAIVHTLGDKGTLHPVSVTPETPLSQALHGELVSLEGRVIERSSSAAQESLMLQFGPWIIDAILEKEQPADRLGSAEPGSIVELTGAYLARLDEDQKVQSFQLLLRSPEDARVLSRPSWWTAQRALWLFAALGALFAVVLAWVTALRRQVHERTRDLRAEIEERKRMEAQMAATHKELVLASRTAGMAEVATSVLHNVGNVLNSVNISATVIGDSVKDCSLDGLGKVSELLQAHAGDLGNFMTNDPKGRQLPKYLDLLRERQRENQKQILAELESLTNNIDHINGIVARQQSYAKSVALTEIVNVTELVEDALRLNAGAMVNGSLKIAREFEPHLPPIEVDKHKVLQILVNLISNAKRACEKANVAEKTLTVRIVRRMDRVVISLTDNGVGIAAEDLTRIFSYGFTTREDGHGFGLHSGALAVKELGGLLTARSEGPGKGAEFVLELPLRPPTPAAAPRKASSRLSVHLPVAKPAPPAPAASLASAPGAV